MNKRIKKKRRHLNDMIIGDHRYSAKIREYLVKRNLIEFRLMPVLYLNNHLICQKNNLKRALRYLYINRPGKGLSFTYRHSPYSRIISDTSTKRNVIPGGRTMRYGSNYICVFGGDDKDGN